MSSLLRLVSLPLRAPMLLVLVAVSVYEGLHWTGPTPSPDAGLLGLPVVMWSIDCLHAVVVVHLYGQPADMDPIMALARARVFGQGPLADSLHRALASLAPRLALSLARADRVPEQRQAFAGRGQ